MKNVDLSKVFELPFEPHSVRMPKKIMEELKSHSKKEGRTLSAMLTYLVVDYLKTKREK